MKRVIGAAVVSVLLASLLLAGCGWGVLTGSGNLETETLDFTDFTRVSASSGFQLELIESDTFRVEVTADDNMHEYLEVSKSGDMLNIGLEFGRSYRSIVLRAEITLPELHGVELSGGSRADITGFSSTHDFSAALSGGSRVTGDITAADAGFDLSGGSQVTLAGSADDLDINGSGGSQLDLEDFSAGNVDINLSGGSRATINVNGNLDANLSGGSKVFYVGEPDWGDINVSGGATVSRK